MKMMMKTLPCIVLLGILVWGCSDLKDELPAASPGSQIHPGGWKTAGSAEFHGQAIRLAAWDMRSCKTCHGGRYDGGTSGYSCRTCHTDILGPEQCNVCHGSAANSAPPRDLSGNTDESYRGVGAHQVHLLGTARAQGVGCSDCHALQWSTIYDPIHIDANAPRAEINFSGRAKLTTGGVAPSPSYIETSGACSNTYCHGAFKNGNGANPMFWNGGAALAIACGTCHGDVTKATLAEKALPKTATGGGTHPNNLACSTCHGGVVNANLGFVNAQKHMDGKLNLNGSDIGF